jgi:hypothetical protein
MMTAESMDTDNSRMDDQEVLREVEQQEVLDEILGDDDKSPDDAPVHILDFIHDAKDSKQRNVIVHFYDYYIGYQTKKRERVKDLEMPSLYLI